MMADDGYRYPANGVTSERAERETIRDMQFPLSHGYYFAAKWKGGGMEGASFENHVT